MSMKEFRKSARTIRERKDTVAMYFHDVKRYDCISAEKEVELVRIIREGGASAEKAREQLINANLRFVISVANQYKSSVLELSDLISEGNMGLIKAVEQFDDTRGFKFTTYAVWWIRQHIMKAISNTNSTLRVPQNKQTILRQYYQMLDDVMQKEHRSITIDEFCEVSGYSYDTVSELLQTSFKAVNIDSTLSEDSDTTYGDFLASDSATDADLDAESLTADLQFIMKHVLTFREAFVLKKMYGLDDKPMTLAEISEEINVSRERVRQISVSAIEKIRKSPYASTLALHLAA